MVPNLATMASCSSSGTTRQLTATRSMSALSRSSVMTRQHDISGRAEPERDWSRGPWISCPCCVVRHASYRKRSAGRVGQFPSVMATGRRCLVEHLRQWALLEYGRIAISWIADAALDRPLTMGRDHHVRVPGGESILHAPTESHRKWSPPRCGRWSTRRRGTAVDHSGVLSSGRLPERPRKHGGSAA